MSEDVLEEVLKLTHKTVILHIRLQSFLTLCCCMNAVNMTAVKRIQALNEALFTPSF